MTFPKDVTATAQAVLDGLRTYPDGTYPDESRDLIARAILTERQRCAEVAKREGVGYRDHNLPQAAIGAFQAAKAIEAGQ